MRIKLKIQPGSRKTGFAGRMGDAWKLRVEAPAVDEKASSQYFNSWRIVRHSASMIRIVTGLTSPIKIVEITGIERLGFNRVILESHGTQPDSGGSAAGEP